MAGYGERPGGVPCVCRSGELSEGDEGRLGTRVTCYVVARSIDSMLSPMTPPSPIYVSNFGTSHKTRPIVDWPCVAVLGYLTKNLSFSQTTMTIVRASVVKLVHST
jgi:hypothetical protein